MSWLYSVCIVYYILGLYGEFRYLYLDDTILWSLYLEVETPIPLPVKFIFILYLNDYSLYCSCHFFYWIRDKRAVVWPDDKLLRPSMYTRNTRGFTNAVSAFETQRKHSFTPIVLFLNITPALQIFTSIHRTDMEHPDSAHLFCYVSEAISRMLFVYVAI